MTREKTKIVTLCGSSRFVDIMAVCAWLIERDERAITMGLHLIPAWYFDDDNFISDHLAESEGVADDMDKLHLRKIDLSHEIFVVNRDHYIGSSTEREIKYAQQKGLPIRWYTHDEVGYAVERILQKAIECEPKEIE